MNTQTQTPRFEIDGAEYTATEMRDANADDEELLAWLECAQIGETFPAFVACTRIA